MNQRILPNQMSQFGVQHVQQIPFENRYAGMMEGFDT